MDTLEVQMQHFNGENGTKKYLNHTIKYSKFIVSLFLKKLGKRVVRPIISVLTLQDAGGPNKTHPPPYLSNSWG